jgi:hypothetical protein
MGYIYQHKKEEEEEEEGLQSVKNGRSRFGRWRLGDDRLMMG